MEHSIAVRVRVFCEPSVCTSSLSMAQGPARPRGGFIALFAVMTVAGATIFLVHRNQAKERQVRAPSAHLLPQLSTLVHSGRRCARPCCAISRSSVANSNQVLHTASTFFMRELRALRARHNLAEILRTLHASSTQLVPLGTLEIAVPVNLGAQRGERGAELEELGGGPVHFKIGLLVDVAFVDEHAEGVLE